MPIHYLFDDFQDGDRALIYGRDESMTVHDAMTLKAIEEGYDNDCAN